MLAGKLSPSSGSAHSWVFLGLGGWTGWTGSSPCPLFFLKSLTLFSGFFNNPSLIMEARFPAISLRGVGLNPACDRTGCGSNGQLVLDWWRKLFKGAFRVLTRLLLRGTVLHCCVVASLPGEEPAWLKELSPSLQRACISYCAAWYPASHRKAY